MPIKLHNLQAFLCAVLFFCLSLYVFPYYYGGDQAFYRSFYEGVQGLSIVAAFDFYRDTLGSSEPGYFVFVYLLSEYFSKDLLFSLVNSLFVFLLFSRLFAARVSMLVLLPLFFNYYLLVLLFSAERLKFSLALFILATFFVGVARYALLIVSVLAHAQTVILFLVLQAYRVRLAFRSFFAGIVGVDSFAIFAALAGLLAVFGLMSGHILQKLAIYYELWGGVGGMLKPAVFAFLAVLYAERKLEAFIASSCVVLLAFFLGSERLTIFSYFIFMYYALQYNRGLNIAVIATSIFFAIKGFLFLQVALEYGDGFYGVAS